MSANEYSVLGFLAVMLIGVIGYFLKDAHNQLKIKADKDALEGAVDALRNDQKAAEERYRREADRMERQYDVKFSGVVKDFSDRMNSIEHNLSQQINLILELLKHNRG